MELLTTPPFCHIYTSSPICHVPEQCPNMFMYTLTMGTLQSMRTQMCVFKVPYRHRSRIDRLVGGMSVASNRPLVEIHVVFGCFFHLVWASRIAEYHAVMFHAVCFELSKGELSFIHWASVEDVQCMLTPKTIENAWDLVCSNIVDFQVCQPFIFVSSIGAVSQGQELEHF